MKSTWLYDYGDDGGGTGDDDDGDDDDDDDDDDGGDGKDGDDSTIHAARRITYKVHFATDVIVGYT